MLLSCLYQEGLHCLTFIIYTKSKSSCCCVGYDILYNDFPGQDSETVLKKDLVWTNTNSLLNMWASTACTELCTAGCTAQLRVLPTWLYNVQCTYHFSTCTAYCTKLYYFRNIVSSLVTLCLFTSGQVAWTVHHGQNHTLLGHSPPATPRRAAVLGQPSCLQPQCREIITVKGQSYVSRLPKY